MLKNILLTSFLTLMSNVLFAAPSADLWQIWQAHNPASNTSIDHSVWDSFIKRYVNSSRGGINLVRYKDVSQDDKNQLRNYLTYLTSINIRLHNRAEQKAYWINLYNALTVNIILQHYPVDSIRDIDISPGFFSKGPWKKKLLSISGEEISLDDIEHRILRPIWQDPRIHYAVNCASIGCPNLQLKAFTSGNSGQLLDRAAREFINHPRAVRFEGKALHLSSIYKWFSEDFGKNEVEIIQHLQQYAEPKLQKQLAATKDVADYHYDWNLNQVN